MDKIRLKGDLVKLENYKEAEIELSPKELASQMTEGEIVDLLTHSTTDCLIPSMCTYAQEVYCDITASKETIHTQKVELPDEINSTGKNLTDYDSKIIDTIDQLIRYLKQKESENESA